MWRCFRDETGRREQDIAAARQQVQLSDPRIEIVPASEVLTMEDKPLEGIRRKKDSSLVRAIELVRNNQADAIISPGNTGALVAGSMKLGRLDGVERCFVHLDTVTDHRRNDEHVDPYDS